MAREKWYDTDNYSKAQRGAFGAIVMWVIGIVLLAAVVGIGVWGFKVITSDAKGRGDTTIRQNSADNRISAQAFFEDTYQAVLKFDLQINDAQAAYDEFLATTPVPASNDSVQVQLYTQKVNSHQTTIEGLQQQCRNAVAAYNAEARKTIREDWRSEDLPYQIDEFSGMTDCLAN